MMGQPSFRSAIPTATVLQSLHTGNAKMAKNNGIRFAAATALRFENGEWLYCTVPANRWLRPVFTAAEPISQLLGGFTLLTRNKFWPDTADEDTAWRAWNDLKNGVDRLSTALQEAIAVSNLRAAETIVCEGLNECCGQFKTAIRKGLSPSAIEKFHRNYQLLVAQIHSEFNSRADVYDDHRNWVAQQARETCLVKRLRACARRLRMIGQAATADGQFYLNRVCATAARLVSDGEDAGKLHIKHDGIRPKLTSVKDFVDQTEPWCEYWTAVCTGLGKPSQFKVSSDLKRQADESASMCDQLAESIAVPLTTGLSPKLQCDKWLIEEWERGSALKQILSALRKKTEEWRGEITTIEGLRSRINSAYGRAGIAQPKRKRGRPKQAK